MLFSKGDVLMSFFSNQQIYGKKGERAIKKVHTTNLSKRLKPYKNKPNLSHYSILFFTPLRKLSSHLS